MPVLPPGSQAHLMPKGAIITLNPMPRVPMPETASPAASTETSNESTATSSLHSSKTASPSTPLTSTQKPETPQSQKPSAKSYGRYGPEAEYYMRVYGVTADELCEMRQEAGLNLF